MSFWSGFTKRASAYKKRSYGTVDIADLDPSRKDEIWSSKLDGAHSAVVLKPGEIPQLFSHRISKRTGNQISYNSKLPHIGRPTPFDAVLRAEVFAIGKDRRAVHPDVVTSILNSGAEKSLEMQKRLGLKTKAALIDVDRFDGKDMSTAPYADKLKIMRQVVKASPDFMLPAIAKTPAAKKKLLSSILAGTHPQTLEGLVVHKGNKFLKAKITDDHDVYVRSIFQEENVKPGRAAMAGGFHYSWEPEGPIVGKVGTGFDHGMKKDMAASPEDYVGKVARVKALAVSKNKVLMKPSFLGWHVDKNLKDNP